MNNEFNFKDHTIINLIAENSDLQDRIEKVIKYVKDNLVSQFDIDYIVSVLRGEDHEE